MPRRGYSDGQSGVVICSARGFERMGVVPGAEASMEASYQARYVTAECVLRLAPGRTPEAGAGRSAYRLATGLSRGLANALHCLLTTDGIRTPEPPELRAAAKTTSQIG